MFKNYVNVGHVWHGTRGTGGTRSTEQQLRSSSIVNLQNNQRWVETP